MQISYPASSLSYHARGTCVACTADLLMTLFKPAPSTTDTTWREQLPMPTLIIITQSFNHNHTFLIILYHVTLLFFAQDAKK